jgi:parvulin-like peptidyl-prolyl isomerase
MIGTIRKHSKWLWIIIIVATVIAFVIFFSPNQRFSGSDGGGRDANFGSINGERISREDFINAQREVLLQYFFRHGEPFREADAKRTGFDLDRETYFRLLLIQKQKQLGIHVSMEAIKRTRDDILRSFNRGNEVPLEAFEKQVLNPHGLTGEDFRRFIQYDLGIQQLMVATGLSGRLVTPQEARLLYEREHEELSAEAVFFSGSNYLAGVTATPEVAAQFFTNQMARYRLPDRVQVKYVEFPATNYQAEAKKQFAELTNLTEIVEAKYRELGTNYFRDAKSPAEAKDKIRELMFKNQMLLSAQKAANTFAHSGLFDSEPMLAENLDKFAKTNGLTVHVSEPFDRDYGPKNLAVSPAFTKRAFTLSADEPLGGPLAGDDAVYIIALYKKLPSEIPPLENIRDRVTADYKYSQAVKAATQAGEAFASALTNGLAKGKKFSAVCSEANVKSLLSPPFSLSTRALPQIEEHVSLNEFKRAAFTTPLGQSSGFVPTSEGGFLVFVRERLPLELTKMTADLPAFMNAVRQARQNEAFNDWFRKEAEKGLRDTPIFQKPPPQMTGAPKS